MSENIIILGAGFSHDAGVPLLSSFIERMWEYSLKGKSGEVKITDSDRKILSEAMGIRLEMDGYHGRVAFDDRNIEDILSMLAFNQLGGSKLEEDKLKSFTNAISTTIELACNTKHSGIPSGPNPSFSANKEGPEVYRTFWKAMFEWYRNEKSIPTIITFNYDLVLERSLNQVLINKYYDDYGTTLPFKKLSLNYHNNKFPKQNYELSYASYGYGSAPERGTIMRHSEYSENAPVVELLKLHGSVNFPSIKPKNDNEIMSITNKIDDPDIVPPVSNKQTNSSGNQTWKIALQRLRAAKNVIFVGYSLPKTDMYMQFFLKAALGPNQELNKIFVFDPELRKGSSTGNEMRKRYEMCFAEQLRSRIVFNPPRLNENNSPHTTEEDAGTTKHFVTALNQNPKSILF